MTVLVDGIPNNEATEGSAEPLSFSDRLLRLLPVPLAADYRDFDPAQDKVDRGRFQASWYKLLADLYQEFGITRAQIEQREERRRSRRRRMTTVTIASIMIALATLAGWAWLERGRAIRNLDLAVGRQLVAESELAMAEAPTRPELSILLALEGYAREASADADRILRRAAAVVPEVVWTGRHNGPVWTIRFSSDGDWLASAGEDGTARLWRGTTGEELDRFEHPAPVRALAISSDGRLLATGTSAGTARLYTLPDGQPAWSIDLGAPILGLGFSSDPCCLLATSRKEGSRHLGLPLTVHRLQLESGAKESFSRIDGIGLEARGELLLTVDGLWDPAVPDATEPLVGFQNLGQHRAYGEIVRAAALSEDGGLLALGTREVDPYADRGSGSLRLYDQRDGRELHRSDFQGGIHALALSPRSAELVLTAGEDGTGRLRSTTDGREVWRLSHAGQVRSVAWHPAGDLFATSGDDGEVRVYRTREVEAAWRPDGTAEHRFTTLSEDGRQLAFVQAQDGEDQMMVRVVGEERLASFPLDPDEPLMEPRPLTFGAEGRWIATGSTSGLIEIREAANGALVKRAQDASRQPIVLLAIDPAGTRAATGSWDQTVRSRPLLDDGVEWQIELPHRPSALQFSADSSWLFAGSEDGQVLVLEGATGTVADRFDHPSAVTALAADPSGRRVAVGGADRVVRLVDLESGSQLADIPISGQLEALAFIDGGARLLVAYRDSSDDLWLGEEPLTPDALRQLGCVRLTRNLTSDEWREHVGSQPYRTTCPTLPRGR